MRSINELVLTGRTDRGDDDSATSTVAVIRMSLK